MKASWHDGSFLLVFAILAAWTPGQMHWVSLPSPMVVPANRASCYDAARDRIVMAGYGTAEFDGLTWSQPSPSPELLEILYGGAYDPVRGVVVVREALNPNTWEWNGISWQLASSGNPASLGASHCFHAGRQRVVMLARNAYAGGVYRNELWEWDGVQWLMIPNSGAIPGNLFWTGLVYDELRDTLVAFGGMAGPFSSGETWEWSAAHGWVLADNGGPSGWNEVRLVLDSSRGVQVLLVGPQFNPCQVYERSGSGPWTLVPSGSRADLGGDLVYDSRRRRVVLLNWDGTMLSWEPVHPARYDLHGPGCPGTLGTPTLSLTNPWNLPRIGDTLQATVDHALLGFAVLGMGFQASTYSGQPLPIDLGAYQMPGCHLRVPLDATVLLLGAPPTLSFSLPIPNQAGLLGVQFFQQAAIWDPPLNATGIGWTNSMAGLVGAL